MYMLEAQGGCQQCGTLSNSQTSCSVLRQGLANSWAVSCCATILQANQPAYYVPQYLQSAGVDVVPVPVFYPDVTHILGQQVYRKVQDVPGERR